MELTSVKFKQDASVNDCFSPVSFGIPLPRGRVLDCSHLVLKHASGDLCRGVFRSVLSWPDGSLRWVVCDALLKNSDLHDSSYQIALDSDNAPDDSAAIFWEEQNDRFSIATGVLDVVVPKACFGPFSSVCAGSQGATVYTRVSGGLYMLDAQDQLWEARPENWTVSIDSGQILSLQATGSFGSQLGQAPLKFSAAMTFCAGCEWLDLSISLHNQQAAHHPGNLWDLGDGGSILFKSCVLHLDTPSGEESRYYIHREAQAEGITSHTQLSLYQASSGGANWDCSQHRDGQGRGPEFRGYLLEVDGAEAAAGDRATPILVAADASSAIGVYVESFWQNFPKQISAQNKLLEIALFPERPDRLYELQGGEQKTHSLKICFTGSPQDCLQQLRNATVAVTPVFDPDWLQHCFAGGALISFSEPDAAGDVERSLSWLEGCVDSRFSLTQRREFIDEYGWRNFGELYADHEAVFQQGNEPFISHYNNQYDAIKGFLLQFFKSGKPQWFQLAKELAVHVVDIDIYHTDEDRYQYNHGLFWHTDHHLPAATATHRAFSKDHLEHNPHTGGGPAPDHNYATGLTLMYLLTGEQRYRDAALELIENIRQLVLGPDTVCEHLFQKLKLLSKKLKRQPQVGDPAYSHVFGLLDGPGRASGNGLNTLLDGFLLTADMEYLALADRIIGHCVSDTDDLEALGLRNPELRWMYTIFLKSLARYIKVKKEYGHYDTMLDYARRAFLHYAGWMLENEYFYLDKPDLLEFPNETWAAQELRKADVLAAAAAMTDGELQQRFMDRARFFFETAIVKLRGYDQPFLTRPLVLMMVNGSDFLALQASQTVKKGAKPYEKGTSEQPPRPFYKPAKCRTLLNTLFGLNIRREMNWFKQRM